MSDRAAAVARLRALLATARASSPATVVDEVAALLPTTMPGVKIIYAVVEDHADGETFGFVLRELVVRHPEHWLRGFGDEGAAADLLADEERHDAERSGT